MGKLIDADAFLQNLINCDIGRKSLEKVVDAVKKQPNAYDMDKFVEQLEKVAFERYGNDGMGGERVVNLDDVIEIVKGGGVDG